MIAATATEARPSAIPRKSVLAATVGRCGTYVFNDASVADKFNSLVARVGQTADAQTEHQKALMQAAKQMEADRSPVR